MPSKVVVIQVCSAITIQMILLARTGVFRKNAIHALPKGPGLRGPREEIRCLYMCVVRSMVLYEAPSGSPRCNAQIGSLQRLIVIRGYRTISHETVTILARSTLFDILPNMGTMLYDEIRPD